MAAEDRRRHARPRPRARRRPGRSRALRGRRRVPAARPPHAFTTSVARSESSAPATVPDAHDQRPLRSHLHQPPHPLGRLPLVRNAPRPAHQRLRAARPRPLESPPGCSRGATGATTGAAAGTNPTKGFRKQHPGDPGRKRRPGRLGGPRIVARVRPRPHPGDVAAVAIPRAHARSQRPRKVRWPRLFTRCGAGGRGRAAHGLRPSCLPGVRVDAGDPTTPRTGSAASARIALHRRPGSRRRFERRWCAADPFVRAEMEGRPNCGHWTAPARCRPQG